MSAGGIYPPGTPAAREVETALVCLDCGHERDAVVVVELGTSTPVDEACPECGSTDWGFA